MGQIAELLKKDSFISFMCQIPHETISNPFSRLPCF